MQTKKNAMRNDMPEKTAEEAQVVNAKTIQQNMLWNVIGSVGFIAAQWMMTILIVHLADYTQAGHLSLGLSLTNVFTNIAYFCIRNFQVSDEKAKYSADLYVTHRFVLTLAAFGIYVAFVLLNRYSAFVAIFLILFMGYRLSEPIVDVFHGIDQRAWRLDIAGKSFLMRGLLTLVAFVAVELWTGNLVITTLAMLIAAYGVVVFWDIPKAKSCETFRLQFDWDKIRELTKECFPLFLYAICLNAVVPIPRFFLEKISGSEVLGYYSSVAIPASVIQLMASYIFTTFTALFSEYYANGEKQKFMKLFWKLAGFILLLIVAAVLGSALLGEWVLALVFTQEIRPYAYLLMPTVGCCGMIAYIWFMGMILTVIREMKTMTIGAIAGAVMAAAISVPAIRYWGVDGVNVVLFVANLITLLIFIVRFFQRMQNWK